VGAAGMTGSLISFAATPHDLVSAVLSDASARDQLENVLDEARSYVRRLLSRNRHLVEALRDALLERYELIGPEITDVLEAATLKAAPAPVTPPHGTPVAATPLEVTSATPPTLTKVLHVA